MTLLASAVDWDALAQVLWVSVLAGVGVTLCFSLAIVGGTRAVDLRRDGHVGAAAFYGALGVLGLAATVASVVFGIIIMTSK